MKLDYELPTEYEAPFATARGDEIVLACVPFDLAPGGKFCTGFLAVTPTRLIVLRAGALERVVALSGADKVYAGELNSSGMLELSTAGEPIPVVYFTREHMARYTMIANICNDLLEGRAPRVVSTPDERYCPNCNRPFLRNTRICPHCSDRKGMMRRLVAIARPCWPLYALILVLLWVNSALMLLAPVISKHLVNDVLTAKNATLSLLIFFVVLTGLCSLATTLAGALRDLASTKASNLLVRDLRDTVYSKLQAMPLGYLEEKKTGDLMQRINGDTGRIQRFIQNVAMRALNEIFLFIGVAVVVFCMNWRMALLILVPLPISLVLVNRIRSSMRRRYHTQWRRMDVLTSRLNDTLNGIRVVKAFGQEEREIARFRDCAATVRDVTRSNEQFAYTVFPLIRFVVGFGSYFVMLYGGTLVLGGSMGLGELMQFSTYAGYLYSRLEWFSMVPRQVSEAITSAQRVFEILDEEPMPQPKAVADATNIRGNVEFDHVTFGYKSYQSVLRDFTLSVKQGEMIGLVGHSGAGKSTVINLLMRLYDVDQGAITIDGVDLRAFDSAEYKSQLGVVLQESHLFSGSILSNIRYARPDASIDDCIRAAKIANAHDFIVALPNGYDTYVGEKGYRLSGGERQRVAIARAVLSNPRILILDEATASVDTETEQQIQEALSRLIRGRTTFAIAHRLSTLKNADRLVVLEEGKLAELGTHDELMELDGIYARLVRAQRRMTALTVAVDTPGGGPGGKRGGRGAPPPR